MSLDETIDQANNLLQQTGTLAQNLDSGLQTLVQRLNDSLNLLDHQIKDSVQSTGPIIQLLIVSIIIASLVISVFYTSRCIVMCYNCSRRNLKLRKQRQAEKALALRKLHDTLCERPSVLENKYEVATPRQSMRHARDRERPAERQQRQQHVQVQLQQLHELQKQQRLQQQLSTTSSSNSEQPKRLDAVECAHCAKEMMSAL